MIATLARLILGLVLTTGTTSVAKAACFSLSVPSGPVTVNYNPLNASDTTQSFTIQITNNTCGSATAQKLNISNVPLADDNSPIGTPVNNGYKSRAIRGAQVVQFDRDTPDSSSESFGTLANGQSATAQWDLLIGHNAVIPYAKRDFTMYVVGRMQSHTIYIAVPVHINVATVTQLSFAGAATTLTMDFGALASNATQTINVSAQATVPFDISWSSENNGVMKNVGSTGWSVPYTATLNGTGVSNSTPYSDTTLGGTQGAITSLPLVVTVGDASSKRAGTYRDVVTITISPH
ncbi:MAG: hypothetical protein JO167_07225 [Alphaproteobacteria bacterium]|nr:hypothetical protein [Alphaproteobacteria bacterium]MBV9541043.1 hypothetical protein [Alphaproteobacteria bacterium]MBV9904106.1 hypothetical protein [Alphaproteobacteria bacterium]